MAVRRLPVVPARDPLERPRTVGDCRGGPRPCPWISCRFSLLVDVLEDGSLVINAPGKLTGAERAIPAKHDHERQWYVIVRLPRGESPHTLPADQRAAIWSLGPLNTARRARQIAAAWTAEFGAGTARKIRRLPTELRPIAAREGDVDSKFLDEADGAIEHWFDEPDPNMPSCALDEIAKIDREQEDDHLLQQIAKHMYVSRERVRQIEASGLLKLRRAGLDPAAFTDEG